MLQDLRQALRNLARRPLAGLAAAASLALGVAAVTGAFTLVRGILVAPLGYPDAGRLVRVYRSLDSLRGSPNPRLAAIWDRVPVSYLDAADWRRRGRTLAEVGLYDGYTAVLDGGGEPLEVAAARIEPELVRALGVGPRLGRVFGSAETARGERLVLLSHRLWESAFGADRGIVGRTVRIDGESHAVTGVMPPGFDLPGRDDLLWTPLTPSGDDLAIADDYRYAAIARLAPGATLEETRAELDRLAAPPADGARPPDGAAGARLAPLLDTVVGAHRRSLGLLSSAAAAVLLIACVNVAHLLLARGLERRGELAVRVALGARPRHLVRPVLSEALPIGAAGAVAGLLLAVATHRVVVALLAGELPRLDEVIVGPGAAAFALAAGLGAALLAGLAPALLAGRVEAVTPAAGRVGAGGAGAAHRALVVVEVALGLVLTGGAGLLAASWLRLAAADPGLEPRGVLVQEVRLPAFSYGDEARRLEFAERLVARLEALPGVRGAALSSRLPAAGPAEVWGFRIAGRDALGGPWTQGRSATMQFVTPGFFRLLGVEVLAGRGFEPGAGSGPERELVVNGTLAERHWPGGEAVGARVVMQEETYTVVGVIEDLRHQGPAEGPGELMLQPWRRRPAASMAVLVAVDGRPEDHAAEVRRALREIEPALPLPPATSLAEVLARSLAGPRSRALLVGLSAGTALLLAVVGSYGVAAQTAGRRRREIAIRMALGADRRRVRRLLAARTLALALAGVALGLPGALASAWWLRGWLPGVEPVGVVAVLGPAALLLLAACLAAGDLPARRTARLDPAATLRSE